MKETNIVKKKSCGKCRHFSSFRTTSRGTCSAYIPLPFWMIQKLEVGDGPIVDETDGKECHLFMDKPNGVEDEPKS